MESISRLSSMLETARDLTLDAARDAGAAAVRRPNRPLPAAQIKRLLDSRIEREVLDGLRRVIAMQYTTPLHVTLPFFPAVLKTLSNPTPQTRPLVYAYLTHHAESDSDTALLSINTIQKSFSDSNARVRALALRTMSALRVPVISQIVSLAIKRALTDISPVVRKTAAFACVKCVRLDPRTMPQVLDYLSHLLADQQYYVVGAAMAAFADVCPEELHLLHPHYQSIVRKLVDMDEWGQLATLRVLTVYARTCFPYRVRRVKNDQSTPATQDDFYADNKNSGTEPQASFQDRQVLDPDLDLLLDTARLLLQSRNSAVVVAVAKAYLYLAPSLYLADAIGPLVALLRGPLHVRQTSLYDIVQVCHANPVLFVPYFRHFLVSTSEPVHVSRLKLELLTLIFPHCEADIQGLILAELDHFARAAAHHDQTLMVRDSVRAIGRCAQTSSLEKCMRLLLAQLHSPAPALLISEALEVIRHLIQRHPLAHAKTVIRLAKQLDTLSSPTARASVIWLVGEFANLVGAEDQIAADVLRILVRGYVAEPDLVREQIVLLAAKVYLHFLNKEEKAVVEPRHPVVLLYDYTMLLARYTPSYDLRDRARLFRALLSDESNTDLASLVLLAPKPVPTAPTRAGKTLTLGSASLVAGVEIKGYTPLPDWVIEGQEPNPALRQTGAEQKEISASSRLDAAIGSSGKTAGKQVKELDKWLDESEGSLSSEDSEGVQSESEDDSTDDEEDDDDDDDDDDDNDEDDDEDDKDKDEDDDVLFTSRAVAQSD